MDMVKAVVGANWGDEGKGKITDMLAEQADIIVRFQGGANAGHTIINDYGKFALHTLPSGVFYDHTTSIIGNGGDARRDRLLLVVRMRRRDGVRGVGSRDGCGGRGALHRGYRSEEHTSELQSH